MIDRYQLVARHNPVLHKVEYESPLTVGNGEFAFTADITGMQTLYSEYCGHHVPLCTMSQWGWHTSPADRRPDTYYTPEDLQMTEYDCRGRRVTYAVEKKSGNEKVYDWLRQNPHRLNLARIALIYLDREISSERIEGIDQRLQLYDGSLNSKFILQNNQVEVITKCDYHRDGLAFHIRSNALATGRLKVMLSFPYGSPDIDGSDWDAVDCHHTKVYQEIEPNYIIFARELDRDDYYIAVRTETPAKISFIEPHQVEIKSFTNELILTVLFTKEPDLAPFYSEEVRKSSSEGWKNYWEKGAAVDLHRSKDPRALELERRIILSQYLIAVQSCGSLPPQETGLTCNSWYGKFHLEMHLWHSAFLPLWNKTGLLIRSLSWYQKILPKAKWNAKRNGYRGAKWPKMVAYDGMDSPSIIATLLIWQQPHVIYLLELAYQSSKEEGLLIEYWDVVSETADYMCDFAVYNNSTGRYDLPSPLIPAQEEHEPTKTQNPTFELEYWSFALKVAVSWAKRLGYPAEQWEHVAKNMAELPVKDGLYLAHENCPLTYLQFNKDHPSMTGAFGLLSGDHVDPDIMEQSLRKVLECWDFHTMWGWDFAMMAMTAVRLGKPELAVDILMMDTPKNSYVKSGNNYQRLRTDLPLYLPGNGSLLLAVALMTAGYQGCPTKLPGFPKNGRWEVEYENMNPFPY